jgi:uncharacterized protein YkwD
MPSSHVCRRRRARLARLAVAVAASAAVSAVPAAAALAATRTDRTVKTTHTVKATHTAEAAHAASVAPSAETVCADENLMPTATNLAMIDAATLCLINQQRADAHIPPLRPNAALDRAATGHSLDMVDEDYFDHTSPSGSTPESRLTAVGYIKPDTSWSIGENIAAATGSWATPVAIVAMWMSDSGHRANILNPSFRDTGIGAAAAAPAMVGSGPGGTYTEDFGVVS